MKEGINPVNPLIFSALICKRLQCLLDGLKHPFKAPFCARCYCAALMIKDYRRICTGRCQRCATLAEIE